MKTQALKNYNNAVKMFRGHIKVRKDLGLQETQRLVLLPDRAMSSYKLIFLSTYKSEY